MRIRNAHGGGFEVHVDNKELDNLERRLKAMASAISDLDIALDRLSRLAKKSAMEFVALAAELEERRT